MTTVTTDTPITTKYLAQLVITYEQKEIENVKQKMRDYLYKYDIKKALLDAASNGVRSVKISPTSYDCKYSSYDKLLFSLQNEYDEYLKKINVHVKLTYVEPEEYKAYFTIEW